jgi:hypothetical protein
VCIRCHGNFFTEPLHSNGHLLCLHCCSVYASCQIAFKNWLLNRKSKLSLENKLIIYKHILKPNGHTVLNYGVVVSHQILKYFSPFNLKHSEWYLKHHGIYVSNQTLRKDLKIPPIQDMIKSNINKYKNRTSVNENQLIKDLSTQTLEERRLKRIWPEDLVDEV